jgi:murein L,D-transpeptidase YcbB/YkuD
LAAFGAGPAPIAAAASGALQAALTAYARIDETGGWPTVPGGPSLHPGARDPSVGRLRDRLAYTDAGAAGAGDRDFFDPELESAVKRFQMRHGLRPDGVVGGKTRAALNVPAGMRAQQIALNIPRLEAMPDIGGERAILVNIPGFELTVFEHGQPVFSSPVIVGRRSRPTPIFTSSITRITTHPYWRIPRSIAVQDILPKLKRDPSYLHGQSIRVYEHSSRLPEPIDAGAIDWRVVTERNFPFLLVQDPGPLNALGPVKFYMPNKHDVYLHGTPAEALFGEPVRAFSSGCVRVQKALDLAHYLMSRDNAAAAHAMAETLRNGESEDFALAKPVPVHMVYVTAWVDGAGRVQFRDDIYGLDRQARMAPAEQASQPVARSGGCPAPIVPKDLPG